MRALTPMSNRLADADTDPPPSAALWRATHGAPISGPLHATESAPGGFANAARRLLPCLVLLALPGCSGGLTGFIDALLGRDAGPPVPDIESVVLEMPEYANDDWPARVHLVRVDRDDAGTYARLLAVDPTEWFDGAGARKFEDAHPQAHLDSWEIVPGTSIGPFPVDAGFFDDFIAVLLCGVKSDPPPKTVALEGDLRIIVTDSGCEIREQD